MPSPVEPERRAVLLDELIRPDTPYRDPLARVDWDALTLDALWLPETAISLHGDPRFAALPEAQRRRLSHHELLGFAAAGLWLESVLAARLARALPAPPEAPFPAARLLGELREASGQALLCLELQRRAGLPLVDRRLWRAPALNLLARRAPGASVAFWACVLIASEVPDRLYRYVRRHAGDVCPAIVGLATAGAISGARRIAHARTALERRLPVAGRWRRRALAPLVERAYRELVGILFFPDAAVYEAAGLRPGRVWAERARASARRRAFARELLATALRSLRLFGFRLRP